MNTMIHDPMPGVTLRAYAKRNLPKSDRRTYQHNYHEKVWRNRKFVQTCAEMDDSKLARRERQYSNLLATVRAEIERRAGARTEAA